MSTSLPTEITLGRYIFERLKQAGVKSIFGVPGDFNLTLLDHIKDVEPLRWIGNANELNAAYETDGYSRINGFGALITTFGVGELSAVNGVAGSFAEHVGLIHIVGMPSVSATKNKLLLHHTLGDCRFDAFKNMSQHISLKTGVVNNIESAPELIDDLISTGFLHKRPVYLGLPSNFVQDKVPSSLLDKPLTLELPANDEEAETEFVENVLGLISKAEKPIIIVDSCASRHEVTAEVAKLAKLTKFPVFTTPMGKGGFNEDSDEYYGLYVGAFTNPDVKEIVESSDLIISIGGLKSDFNTGSFSYLFNTKNTVDFHSNFCRFKKATYENLQMKHALKTLLERLPALESIKSFVPPPIPASKNAYQAVLAAPAPEGILTHEYLWQRITSYLKQGDVLVTETGTASFGVVNSHFPAHVKAISQVLWGSIGFSLPAAVGATCAVDDEGENGADKRVILFIGDGSLQLTVQAISDAMRWNFKPYIFVLNNKGYTIEKLIHGPQEDYNQIQNWDHQAILPLFADKTQYENHTVNSAAEFDSLLKDEQFNVPSKIRLIELMLDEFDAPANLIIQAKMAEKTNSA